MRIKFACPTCGHAYTVGPALGGRRVRCKHCRAEFRVSQPAPAPVAARAREDDAPARPPSAPSVPAVDWFGVEEPASEPLPRAAYRERTVEDEPEVHLPRRPGRTVATPRRRGSDGHPWGMPVRNAGVGLTILSLFCSVVFRVIVAKVPGAAESVGFLLIIAQAGLWCLALSVTLISFFGALLSFLRGNERALSGEGIVGQVAWVGSIVLSFLVVGLMVFTFSILGLIVKARRGSSVPPADMATYESLIESQIEAVDHYSDVLDSVGPDLNLATSERIAEAARRLRAVEERAEQTPYPSNEQTRQLRARYKERVREVAARNRDAGREAAARIRNVPELSRVLNKTSDGMSRLLASYDLRSALDWYQAVFGSNAGIRASAKPGPGGDVPGPRAIEPARADPAEGRAAQGP